jgi:hemoglobin
MATPIFDKYGGFGTVSKVVLEFYDRVGDSEILAPYFANTDMRTLVDHQTKFIASLMGGPISYTDETIRRVHAHLAITEAAFEEMRSILEETLEDFDFADSDVKAVIREITVRKTLIVAT